MMGIRLGGFGEAWMPCWGRSGRKYGQDPRRFRVIILERLSFWSWNWCWCCEFSRNDAYVAVVTSLDGALAASMGIVMIVGRLARPFERLGLMRPWMSFGSPTGTKAGEVISPLCVWGVGSHARA